MMLRRQSSGLFRLRKPEPSEPVEQTERRLLEKNANAVLPQNSPIEETCPIIGPDGLLRGGVGWGISVDLMISDTRSFYSSSTMWLRYWFMSIITHGSVKQILNEMRSRFYVVKGRTTVHALCVKCTKCRRMTASCTCCLELAWHRLGQHLPAPPSICSVPSTRESGEATWNAGKLCLYAKIPSVCTMRLYIEGIAQNDL